MNTTALAALEKLRGVYSGAAVHAKRSLLQRLARERMRTPAALRRLHELLCWMRAYPDDADVLARVVSLLGSFHRRADLRAHCDALADSGIAGTAIHYRFFAGQAQWLAQRWPRQLTLDRSDREAEQRIATALPVLLSRPEAHALTELGLPGYQALDRVRPRGQTDAAFLLQRIAALPGDGFTREAFSDGVDASFVLAAGADTPSRTQAHWARAPLVFRDRPPTQERPELRRELARAPRRVRRLSRRDGEALVELARAAMVTRARSLEAFSFANPDDAWLVDDGDGLAFGLVGVVPERRHALAAYYGGLTLRNGVPIGYTQADLLGPSAALSFNTFETFRGGEAAFSFARWLAALHHAFGARSFSIEPYQLGRHNDEAIDSGAWWFYAKLGFAPRDAGARRLARQERDRIARRASHRSSRTTLERLAERHLFFDLDASRPRPWVSLAELALRAGAELSQRQGADREAALDRCSLDLARCCGVASFRGWSEPQRQAWRRAAPLVLSLAPARWPEADRLALAQVLRDKGGRGEREFLARYLLHPRFDAALLRWRPRAIGLANGGDEIRKN